jgi:ribosomal protein S18 acetylase RimI-like enzyme
MYAEYLNEVYGKKTLQTKEGFVIYSTDNDILYIEDIYIKPDSRGKGIGKELFNYMCIFAKGRKFKKLMASVVLSSKDSNINLAKYITELGFRITRSNDIIIYLMKEL